MLLKGTRIPLFSTNIAVNNQNVNYRVIFDKDKYVFLSGADNKAFYSFSFRREHDEWLDQELLPANIKTQAIKALEKYLLKQHYLQQNARGEKFIGTFLKEELNLNQ